MNIKIKVGIVSTIIGVFALLYRTQVAKKISQVDYSDAFIAAKKISSINSTYSILTFFGFALIGFGVSIILGSYFSKK